MSDKKEVIRWRDLFPSIRRNALAKTAILIVLGAFLSRAEMSLSLLWTTLLAMALWMLLYAINEAWDLRFEQGRQSFRSLWLFLVAVGVVIVSESIVSSTVALYFAGMALSQVAYSRFRLKKHWWFCLISSGVINPVLRIMCGAAFGATTIPVVAYVYFANLHIGGAVITRSLKRARDKSLGYHILPNWVERITQVSQIIGCLLFFAIWQYYHLPASFLVFQALGLLFMSWFWFYEPNSLKSREISRKLVFIPGMQRLLDMPKEEMRSRLWPIFALMLLVMLFQLMMMVRSDRARRIQRHDQGYGRVPAPVINSKPTR